MEQPKQQASNSDSQLMAGVAGFFKNMFGLLLSRIELAALELAEVRTNLLKLVLVSALGLIAVWFALAYWSALLVYLTWDSLGWKILLIVAMGFTAAAIGVLFYVRNIVALGKLSMPATMSELRNDRDALL
jgi:uncharacterized membrane protein YqjE